MMEKKKANPKAYLFGPFLFAHKSKVNADAIIAIYEQRGIDAVISGPRGLSPEMKVKKLECSICRNDYEECDHTEGVKYGDEICECLIADFEAINITYVSNPQDPRARVTDMLVFGTKNGKKSYTWYGFEIDNEDRRFVHIQKAMDNGFIPESAAKKFSTFFCSNQTGVAFF